jgi:HSP20 family protein
MVGAVTTSPRPSARRNMMTLMKRRQNELDWPTWFGRPLVDFPTLWTDMMDDTTLKLEEFEDEGTHVVRAEMPGIDPEKDVDITIGDGRLHIHAERRAEKTTDDKSGYKSEFQYGSFERTMRMPPGATESDVTASYKDGILEVRVPIDTTEAQSKRVPVVRS